MRDVRPEGDFVVNGNFTVNEGNQNNFIPFEQMNLEQLQSSLKHHQNLENEERSKINGIAYKLVGFALFVGLILAIWYFVKGGVDNAMFLVGLVGIGVPVLLALKTGEKRTDFEQRQINTIKYISTLIREHR